MFRLNLLFYCSPLGCLRSISLPLRVLPLGYQEGEFLNSGATACLPFIVRGFYFLTEEQKNKIFFLLWVSMSHA